MLPQQIALLVAMLFAPGGAADQIYTVWGSVIYNRGGQQTPERLGQPVLTGLGARQAYTAGASFRDRYLTATNGSIRGMNKNLLSSDQLYVLALDQQPSVASAQAFTQGLYPPVSLNSSTTFLDPNSINGQEYTDAPLGGYQYAQLHVSGSLDPDYTFLGGNIYCPAFDMSKGAIIQNPQYRALWNASQSVYAAMTPITGDSSHTLDDAVDVYEYVNWLVEHNSTAYDLMHSSRYIDPATNQSYSYTLKWLADARQQYLLANMSAHNDVTGTSSIPNTPGSISTIAGNMLAGIMLYRLEGIIASYLSKPKQAPQPLSILFGDADALVSLFALMNMPHASANFSGMPGFASSLAFELYSRENSTMADFPDPSQLFVSLHFRNGTSNSSSLETYAPFGRGPSQTETSWYSFQSMLLTTSLGTTGDWCGQCGSNAVFCDARTDYPFISSSPTSATSGRRQLSPVAAGAVGAVVSLAIASVIFALVMLFGRVRLHRKPRPENDLKGFKGSTKLASDRDLVLPKTGVVAAAEEVPAGHERSGSWEMKDASDTTALPKASFESEALRVNPFSDPVKAHEHV